MICPVTYLAWCEARKVMTSATSPGWATCRSGPAAASCATAGVIQPVSVTGGVEHVRGNGETTGSAGREADDAARGGAASDMATSELGNQEGGRPGINGKLTVVPFGVDLAQNPAEPILAGGQERVSQPPAGVVHENLNRAKGGFGPVKQLSRDGRTSQVGLQTHGSSTGGLDAPDHFVRRPPAHGPVVGREGRVVRVLSRVQPQVGEEDSGSVRGEGFGGRGTDALVGSGDECNPPVQTWVDHNSIFSAGSRRIRCARSSEDQRMFVAVYAHLVESVPSDKHAPIIVCVVGPDLPIRLLRGR